jgi:hypothetical protein
MRAIFLALLILVCLAPAASAERAGPSGAFPRDAVSLRDLDSRQLRIVRRATAQCWHSGEAGLGGFRASGARGRACIIGGTESAIRSSDDTALKAFHQALPFNARYNENRPAHYWQRMVAK